MWPCDTRGYRIYRDLCGYIVGALSRLHKTAQDQDDGVPEELRLMDKRLRQTM